MTAPAKQSSRWGSFLQQALDGVESRLDNILVGDGPVEPGAAVASPANVKLETGPARSSNTHPTNDRLQERLAKAIAAKKYAAARYDSTSISSQVPSRVGSPVTNAESSRQSFDTASVASEDASADKKENETGAANAQFQEAEPVSLNTVSGIAVKAKAIEPLAEPGTEESPRQSLESNSSSAQGANVDRPSGLSTLGTSDTGIGKILVGSHIGQSDLNTADGDTMNVLQKEHEISDLQRQEEIHGYIERIDALQAKLQYLSRESAEAARKAAAAAPSSAEKKLAEKDEQIALLMEEGQKLSKTELKHMTVIKKLRAKAAETEKEASETKRKLERTEKEKVALLDRLKWAETTEKQSAERHKALAQLQRDLETVTEERDVKNITIGELRVQLLDAASQAKASEVKAAQDLLAVERRRVADLENEVASLKIEKELAAGRAKAQLEELRAKSEREAERARIAEVEMRAEQQMLESRLEVIRTRAEEVSSGAAGDAQAKLLRQIETLQSQYAVASENWQGIQGSLTTRVTSLEKERDEAMKRETDIKRKARELTTKSNRNEEELEDSHARMQALQRELNENIERMDKLQLQAETAKSALVEARKEFDEEIQALKAEMQQRLDDDRVKWREDVLGHPSYNLGRAESPVPSSHRNLTADLLGLQNLQTRPSVRSFTNELPKIESRASRKSSIQHVRSWGHDTPQRQDSGQSYANGEGAEPSSAHTVDHDEYFEHVQSPSPTHLMAHDVLSVSTVAAGPSVQLVERMSAAVRRLEGERVSTKEELRRLSGQRDEARAQIVTLMQEVESKRNIDNRVRELEEQNRKINARYQTTLEMLGEKSELVEELRADVQDVKDMYRELVERTVK